MFSDLVKKSRSYRSYNESRMITDEELAGMIELTRYCPSSINLQPLKYVPVNEPEKVKQILACTKWAIALKDYQLPPKGHAPTAFILICQDKSVRDSIPAFAKDVGIVAQTMLLGATEMGLGGCMIGSFDPVRIPEIMGLPEQLQLVLVLAIGEPDETITLTDPKPDGTVGYYRDEAGQHYVPKRTLDEIIVNL